MITIKTKDSRTIDRIINKNICAILIQTQNPSGLTNEEIYFYCTGYFGIDARIGPIVAFNPSGPTTKSWALSLGYNTSEELHKNIDKTCKNLYMVYFYVK